MKKREGLFDLRFDPSKSPSAQSRYKSLDAVSVGVPLTQAPDTTEAPLKQLVKDAEHLPTKLKSFTDQKTLPSVILRRKGIRV